MRLSLTILRGAQGPIAECRIGLRSVPYLADHGFQDMVVLPGAFYVNAAMLVHEEIYRRKAGSLRRIRFEHPAILTDEDTVILIMVQDRGDGWVEYSFFDAEGETGADEQGAVPFARIEAERDGGPALAQPNPRFSPVTFRRRAASTLTAESFYEKLRGNGNQYGPSFQKITGLWRSKGEALAELRAANGGTEVEAEAGILHPTVIDSMTQLLSAFMLERGKVFVLRAIEEIAVHESGIPTPLWVHAALRSDAGDDEDGLIGDLRVMDDEGELYLELRGVAFAFLDRVPAAEERPRLDVRIAATFTAQPIEEALRFWGNQLDTRLRTEHLPYNQVVQQLLDTGSALRRNREGINVLLLGLDDWARAAPVLPAPASRERLEACLSGQSRCTLPNGLEIAHLNRHETDYLYREIFEDRCYLRHGIRLRDGATVIDIGANIGLFTLFVLSHCRKPTIYAFEPSPVVYGLLEANCRVYGRNVHSLNVGVSDRAKTASFTFYDKSSVFSGFYPDELEDREAIRAVVRNVLEGEAAMDGDSLDPCLDELMEERTRRRTYRCRLTSVSEIIRDHRIERIDLLKIDAEKSEWDILQGIEDHDWLKIDQIVVEVHDRTRETTGRIVKTLSERGFRCEVDEEAFLQRSGLHNVYATKSERLDARLDGSERRREGPSGSAPASERGADPCSIDVAGPGSGDGRLHAEAEGLRRNVRDFCAALESFTSRAVAPLILCLCPRTSSTSCGTEWQEVLDDAERVVLSAASRLPNVRTIGTEALAALYPVENWFDPYTHQLGHIPYTRDGYAAIATMLVRTVFGLKSRRSKVIVLDCDNTLWRGVCGEDGALGVAVTGPYRALQEFMIGRLEAGMLICLCSKNNEQDVLDVLETNPGMALRREHLAAWRINWRSKSENLRALADELRLGLDSFIVLDDSPLDCAELRARCPEVLTLQLPAEESIPRFLEHVWAFDTPKATEEDRNRTRMYQENMRRERLRGQALSLAGFIESLELRVEIDEPGEDDWSRVSELTYRTNQFNLTTRRLSEGDVRDLLLRDGVSCLTVRVADRFGDYGLVGVVLYAAVEHRYRVDGFLLSCRVLGRGVEHRVLADLGRRAARQGVDSVELTYRPTEKNRPALEFLRDVAGQCREAAPHPDRPSGQDVDPSSSADGLPRTSWTFPARLLTRLEYRPTERAPGEAEAPATDRPAETRAAPSVDFAENVRGRMQRIAGEWREVKRIVAAMDEPRQREPIPLSAEPPARGSLEEALADIWRRVLNRPSVAVNDNFFEAGGTSLRAIQVAATIRKELKRNVSIVSLFECPTVSRLAARLSGAPGDSRSGTPLSQAALRGGRRRSKVVRRRSR